MNNLEVIEKYIDNELEGVELFDFEQSLSSNNDIKRDYNLSLEINKSIIEDDVMALRETMDSIYNKDIKVENTSSIFAKPKFYYAAASIALLIASGGLIKQLNKPNLDNNAVFEEYYKPYDAVASYRSGNEDIDRVLVTALEKYEEKDFKQATVLFEQILNTCEDNMSVNLYSGISYMEEEKYQKASTSFNTIIKNNDNLFVEQAKWYLSMCYIKTGKKLEAKNILMELIKEQTCYEEQASKVIEDIND